MAAVRSRDGVAIAYCVRGTGSRALVFLHGWGATGSYFAETIDALDPAVYRAVTVDLRGHGESGKPDADPTFDLLAGDVIAVADAARLGAFVLVGHSMGGKLAQYVALADRGRVEALVLVETAPAAELPTPHFVRRWAALAGDGEAMVREAVIPHIRRPVADHVLRRLARSWETVPRAYLERTLALVESSFAERLEGLDVPVLVVAGARDGLHSKTTDAVLASLPGARLELLDAGSEIPIESPADLARLIDDFTARLP